jgi:hypothetical protein
MINISDKICRGHLNAHFIFNTFFYRAVYEIMWKSTVQPDRPQRMRFACWKTKATNHSEYEKLIASSAIIAAQTPLIVTL